VNENTKLSPMHTPNTGTRLLIQITKEKEKISLRTWQIYNKKPVNTNSNLNTNKII